MRAENTQVIDLDGDTVLPGLNDLHVHPIYAGIRARECRIPQGSTLSETQKIVEYCVAKVGPGKWVTGGQWEASALGQVPSHEMLDGIAPDNPILLEDTSGHRSWVNAKALEVAGMTRETPDSEGSIIERDANGEPPATVLREGAISVGEEVSYQGTPMRKSALR